MSASLFVIHRSGPAWQDGTGYREQPGIERHTWRVVFQRDDVDRAVGSTSPPASAAASASAG